MSAALAVFRRYVNDFVNRQDFSVLPRIMQPDYTLATSGLEICGRDGPYRAAVARQMEQFPGLLFTVHKLFVQGNAIGIHFTEHGASRHHDGASASWPSIAIYELRDGLLARCDIEQDYHSRRRQLAERVPIAVPPPAIAPWDEAELERDVEGEEMLRRWLQQGDWLENGSVDVDDSAAMGAIEPVLGRGRIELLKLLSGRTAGGASHFAFHASASGPLAPEFAAATGARAGSDATLALSGLVTFRDGKVSEGNILRDRWGLFRRLAKQASR